MKENGILKKLDCKVIGKIAYTYHEDPTGVTGLFVKEEHKVPQFMQSHPCVLCTAAVSSLV